MSTQKPAKTERHYKMAEVEKLTGVGREAIRFYLRKGLLPPPVKTSRNMAWYLDRHIELIKSIRELQQEQFLPLKAIKSALYGTPDFAFSDRQLKFFSAMTQELKHATFHPKITRVGARKVKKYVTNKDLAALERLGWIQDISEPRSADDEEVIALWASFLSKGFSEVPGISPDKVSFILEAADVLVERALDFYRKYLSELDQQAAAALVTAVQPDVLQLFSHFYERRVRHVMESLSSRRSSRPPLRKTPQKPVGGDRRTGRSKT